MVHSGHTHPSDTWSLLKSLLRMIHKCILTQVSTWALAVWATGENTGEQGCFVLIQNPNFWQTASFYCTFTELLSSRSAVHAPNPLSVLWWFDTVLSGLLWWNNDDDNAQTEDVIKRETCVSTGNFCRDWWHPNCTVCTQPGESQAGRGQDVFHTFVICNLNRTEVSVGSHWGITSRSVLI